MYRFEYNSWVNLNLGVCVFVKNVAAMRVMDIRILYNTTLLIYNESTWMLVRLHLLTVRISFDIHKIRLLIMATAIVECALVINQLHFQYC